jgi:uncharacterized membrane protein (DUF441 family)
MWKKVESFFFGKIFGRVVSRLAVSAVGFAAAFLASHGLNLTPEQQSQAVGLLVGAANAAWTSIAKWREGRAKASEAPAQ